MENGNSKSIKQIKEDLLCGVNSSAINHLKSSKSPLVLQEYKEHKILLYAPHDESLFEEFIATAKRLLNNGAEIQEEIFYIEFIKTYLIETERLSKNLHGILERELNFDLKPFLVNIF